MKRTIAEIFIVIGILFLGISAVHFKSQNVDLKDKVEFYEEVLGDFGIDEFVNYPELYYNREYVKSTKENQCIWIPDIISMN